MGNIYSIEAEVLGVKDNVFRIKISVLDLGLYMFGFRAKQSDRSPGGWWIQPPATKTPNGWKHNPEFDKKETLWQEIEDSCTNAVKSYASDLDVVYEPSDEEMTDEAISKAIDESIKKFSLEERPNKAIPWMDEDRYETFN